MNLVLVGAPLSGKGTQAELIVEKFGLVHISTGDMFREIMASDSPLSNQVKSFMDKSILVPDEITLKVLQEKLSSLDAQKGVLLDGFPRTLYQAQKLDEILQIDKVIYLKAELSDLLNRIAGRYICEKCKKINTIKESIIPNCINCGGKLIKRKDDTPEIVKMRFDEFLDNTYPLIDFYNSQGKLFEVDSNQPISDIFKQIESCLKSIEND